MTTDLFFRDPYVLDFLESKETLEQKLIDSIEAAKIQMEQRKKINY